MITNPSVGEDNCIYFIRKSGVFLVWIQDLSGRKMKSIHCMRPMVIFNSREEAEKELCEVVIPYLFKEKGVEPEEIVGWPVG